MSSKPSSFNPIPSSPSRQNPPLTLSIPRISRHTRLLSLNLEPQANSCPICTEDYPITDLQTLLPCKHHFCSACLKEYLAVKINSNQVLNISCPQSGCTEIFTDKILEGVLEPDIYRKYRELILKKVSIRGSKQHFCPNPGCSRPFKPKKNKEFTQCTCGTKICNYCNNFYHEGKSCVESIDPEFEIYAKENGIKFCMMCKTIVSREGGCAQITCSVCDYQWCWVCGRSYETIHICTGEWNPVPPSLVLNDGASIKAFLKRIWNESSVFKLIGLFIIFALLSPVILLGFLIVLPVGRVEVSRRRPIKSFFSVLLAIFIGILFWAFVIPALGYYAIGFILISPFLLIGFLVTLFQRRRRQREQIPQNEPPKKRWQTRNSQNFAYRQPPPEVDV